MSDEDRHISRRLMQPQSLAEGVACRSIVVHHSACIERGVPLVVTMGGGYSRPMDASVRAHSDVFRSAVQLFTASGVAATAQ
jgi:hypothetical protein